MRLDIMSSLKSLIITMRFAPVAQHSRTIAFFVAGSSIWDFEPFVGACSFKMDRVRPASAAFQISNEAITVQPRLRGVLGANLWKDNLPCVPSNPAINRLQ